MWLFRCCHGHATVGSVCIVELRTSRPTIQKMEMLPWKGNHVLSFVLLLSSPPLLLLVLLTHTRRCQQHSHRMHSGLRVKCQIVLLFVTKFRFCRLIFIKVSNTKVHEYPLIASRADRQNYRHEEANRGTSRDFAKAPMG